MMFLNGILAGFAALAAIPIIIHLLNRSRFRVVQWAAMEFILRALQKNSRRIQLRDLILMLLRAAAIMLAAFALARPTLAPGKLSFFSGAGGDVTAVIVLDNSMSMATRDANDSRFEIAQRTVKAILKQMPRGSAVTVVMMSDVATAEVTEPTHDLAYLDEAVGRSQVGDGGTSIVTGMQTAWEILRKLPPNGREIYLVTDLQANGWSKADDRSWRELADNLAAAKDFRGYIADVGAPDVDNVSVERIEFTDDIVGTDGTSTVVATLRNRGAAPATQVPVDLLVDDGRGGELRPTATSAIDSLEKTAQVRLPIRFEHGGRHRLEVRSGPDHLAADNVRRLVVDVVDKVRVLVVDGSDGVSASGANYLRAALSPGSLLGNANAGPDQTRSDRIETTIVKPSDLSALALDDFHAVILSDVGEPSMKLADGLKLFVSGGKGLILFLGGNVRPEVYNSLLGERGLMPGVLGSAPRVLGEANPDPKQTGLGFITEDLTHPIVAFFNDKGTQPFFARPRIKKSWPLVVAPAEPPKPDEDGITKPAVAVVVARFADGSPAIAAKALGRGEVVTYCLPADKEWSDLPLHAAFLMLAQRSLQHVALGNRPRLSVGVHDTLSQVVSARDASERFIARDPRGGERFVTPVVGSDGQMVLEQGDTPYAGFYTFTKDDTTFRFAANPPADESDLSTFDHKAIDERFEGVAMSWIGTGEDSLASIERTRIGREIWPYLLILAIACLLAESLLALKWAPKGA